MLKCKMINFLDKKIEQNLQNELLRLDIKSRGNNRKN